MKKKGVQKKRRMLAKTHASEPWDPCAHGMHNTPNILATSVFFKKELQQKTPELEAEPWQAATSERSSDTRATTVNCCKPLSQTHLRALAPVTSKRFSDSAPAPGHPSYAPRSYLVRGISKNCSSTQLSLLMGSHSYYNAAMIKHLLYASKSNGS